MPPLIVKASFFLASSPLGSRSYLPILYVKLKFTLIGFWRTTAPSVLASAHCSYSPVPTWNTASLSWFPPVDLIRCSSCLMFSSFLSLCIIQRMPKGPCSVTWINFPLLYTCLLVHLAPYIVIICLQVCWDTIAHIFLLSVSLVFGQNGAKEPCDKRGNAQAIDIYFKNQLPELTPRNSLFCFEAIST